MTRGVVLFGLLALLSAPVPLRAQEGPFAGQCDRAEIVSTGAREGCLAAAQAIASAQSGLGILIAGGNPTVGSAGVTGLRLGFLPRVSTGVRIGFVSIRIPDLLAEQAAGQLGAITRRLRIGAPAIAGDLSIGISNGVSFAPGIGGIGGLSMLGSLAYLPFNLLDETGFSRAELAWGLGGRLHLLQESFILPGVSLSLMRRSLPEISFGDVCPQGVEFGSSEQDLALCAGPGDPGEFSTDLVDWSTRLVASKRFFGLGVTAGAGYDRYRSHAGIGFRGTPLPGSEATPVFRLQDQRLKAERWTLFGNLSYTLLVGAIGVEAGWQQGHSPIGGFERLEPNFDPGSGTWYGSLGARLSL